MADSATAGQSLAVGFVPLARTTFDTDLAAQVAAEARSALEAAGLALVGPTSLVTDLDATQAAAASLAGQALDLMVILQATFADSSMVIELAQAMDVPLLLWAVPEAATGGRLRLNSLCGINLAAHGLTRRGRRYEYIYASPGDQAATARIATLARAGRVYRLLKGARIGRVGENPAGFDSCRLDAESLRRVLGLEVVQLQLDDVFLGARNVAAPAVKQLQQQVGNRLDGLDAQDQAAVEGTLRSYRALGDLAQQEALGGLAVRCWPEFFGELGCAACGAMSMLSDEMMPCSCEADVNGTITQLILQWLSGQPAFGTDMVSLDEERDGLVLWHCGLAPLSMADPGQQPRATIHSNRRLPLLMEFTLKPGRVTVARLSQATAGSGGHAFRLVIGGGTMVQAPPQFSGTSGVLRFDRPAAQVLDTILREGLEHHISLTYGDHGPALRALAHYLDLPVLEL